MAKLFGRFVSLQYFYRKIISKMKRISLVLVAVFTFILCGYAENNTQSGHDQTPYADHVVLHKKAHKGNKRSIDEQIVVSIYGNTLYIIDNIPSCTLQLADEAGNVFYEAYIPEGTEQWQLPTDQLAGCELRLIIDDVCYYCIL